MSLSQSDVTDDTTREQGPECRSRRRMDTVTSQLYLARGIAAGMIHSGTGGQDPALLRSVEIARMEARRARRGRLAR